MIVANTLTNCECVNSLSVPRKNNLRENPDWITFKNGVFSNVRIHLHKLNTIKCTSMFICLCLGTKPNLKSIFYWFENSMCTFSIEKRFLRWTLTTWHWFITFLFLNIFQKIKAINNNLKKWNNFFFY